MSVALGSGRIPAWALSLMAFHLSNLQFALVAQKVKHLSAVWETQVRSLGWEDPLHEGNGNPLQYSGLENPMDRGAWWAMGSQRVRHD